MIHLIVSLFLSRLVHLCKHKWMDEGKFRVNFHVIPQCLLVEPVCDTGMLGVDAVLAAR